MLAVRLLRAPPQPEAPQQALLQEVLLPRPEVLQRALQLQEPPRLLSDG